MVDPVSYQFQQTLSMHPNSQTTINAARGGSHDSNYDSQSHQNMQKSQSISLLPQDAMMPTSVPMKINNKLSGHHKPTQ